MTYTRKHYKRTIVYSLVNKFNYETIENIPQLKTINLNLDCKTANDRFKLAASLCALELVTTKKGKVNKAKKANSLMKIRKNDAVGCKIYLKKDLMYNFLEKLTLEILPKLKSISDFQVSNNPSQNNVASYRLKTNLIMYELEQNYFFFNNLPNFQINFSTNTKTQQELFFLLKSFKINLIRKKELI